MSENAIPVAEAAAGTSFACSTSSKAGANPRTLMRDGKPVARLIPLPGPATTCGELAERWEKLDKLPPDEAAAFADDIEHARAQLPPLKPAWD